MIPFSESALSLRRRSVWEALDSGILLWRNNFFYFIPFFALPVWICAFCLRLLPGNFFYLSYIVLWWLKPLFDRLLLHVVSRRFFNAASSVRLRDFYRGIWKTLFRGLLGDLLWRRFNPGRAALMPIRVLEEAGGKQFRERKNALAVGGLGFSPFVGILGIAMELLLLAGEILFAVVIVQMFMPSAFSYRSNYMPAMEIYVFCAYCLNFIFVESLYICMSFGLYINSRVEVEGWDLQLLFQKFTGSGSRSKIHRPAGNAVFLICLFLLLSPAVHVSSEESPGGITDELSEKAAEEPVSVSDSIKFFPENFPSVNDDSSDHLKEILASKDFGAEKEGWGIRLKDQKQQGQLPDIAIAPWMEKLRQVFGFVLRAFVVLVLAGFAGFVMYWFFKNYRRSSRSRERYRDRRESRAGSPVLAESPESLFAKAEGFFNRGLIREAWASCFAGYIGAYTLNRPLSFPAGATEYDCLALVQQTLPDESACFDALVREWILLAYGGKKPVDGAFESALERGRSLLGNLGPADEA